jgi:hypothetical protein
MLHKSRVTPTPESLDTTECGICLLEIDTLLYTTPCGHKYHRNCLHKWCVKNNSCPTCRCENVMPKSIYTKVFEYFERINKRHTDRINNLIHAEVRVAPHPYLGHTSAPQFGPPHFGPPPFLEALTSDELYVLRGNDARAYRLHRRTVLRALNRVRNLPSSPALSQQASRRSFIMAHKQILDNIDDVDRIWRIDNDEN